MFINCGAIDQYSRVKFWAREGSIRATCDRRKFQLADRGTLVLDEIGDMPLDLQVKFQVMEEQKVQPVGGNQSLQTDVRLVAATNKI